MPQTRDEPPASDRLARMRADAATMTAAGLNSPERRATQARLAAALLHDAVDPERQQHTIDADRDRYSDGHG